MNRYTLHPADPFQKFAWGLCRREVRMADTVTLLGEVDLSAVQALRRAGKGEGRPSYTAFVVKALALTLKAFPLANRRLLRHPWIPLGPLYFQQFEHSDVMIAVEKYLPGDIPAVLLEVIRDAASKPVSEINDCLRALSRADETNNAQWRTFKRMLERFPAWLNVWLAGLVARYPSLWSRYRGGAAVVSVPCKYGGDAIVTCWSSTLGLSFGRVKERAVARNGACEVRPTTMLTMNFDRRVMPGAPAARFFQHLVDLLEDASGALANPLAQRELCHSRAATSAGCVEESEVCEAGGPAREQVIRDREG